MQSRVHPFFDISTSTFTYVVHGDDSPECAIVDSVLGYDLRSGTVSAAPAERVAQFVEQEGLHVQWLLETHVHADHLSGASWLRERLGGRIGISERIVEVQRLFKCIFNLDDAFAADGTDFDHLFKSDDVFSIGSLSAVAMHVPGHTPADLAYIVANEAAFVGDTLFMPDVGTARCDFPGGDSKCLYESVRRILSLDAKTLLYMCHDYPPQGREVQYESDVAAQLHANLHIHEGIDMNTFTQMRDARDAGLPLPQLFFPSIQANIRAGKLPAVESNGKRYFKYPVETD
jgi:glyoxylase-like metal-dependent hydrolase (beta-lactamase superfamily II)